MPIKSKKQWGLMQMAKHNPQKMHASGPSPEVAKEMIDKTPKNKRKIFSKKSK